MPVAQPQRIMMISTHGYVAAEPEFGKPDTGGQVVYVLELSKCLARMGYAVDVLTRQFEGQPAIEPIAERVQLVRLPCGGDDFIPKETLCESIPEWVENAARMIRAEKISYSFINSHYWDAGLAGQALANRFNIPHIHTPHSIGSWKRDNMDGDPAELERKYNFAKRVREEKVIYDESDLLIATTPIQRDILRETPYDVPADKIRVIPPGYDDQRFFPVAKATREMLKSHLGLEGPVVLALGRMAKNKGYDLLVRAMPVVVERVPEARLVLAVGSTEPSPAEVDMINHLRALADELGIADRIVMKDYISDDELADHYRAADVFALSSRYEPFGMTAIEAMACGTPTVITIHGGLYRAITFGRHALYADTFDKEDLGISIVKVLRHPRLAHRLGRMGAHKARSLFTWTGIAQQLISLTEERATARAFTGDEWDEPWNDGD